MSVSFSFPHGVAIFLFVEVSVPVLRCYECGVLYVSFGSKVRRLF